MKRLTKDICFLLTILLFFGILLFIAQETESRLGAIVTKLIEHHRVRR